MSRKTVLLARPQRKIRSIRGALAHQHKVRVHQVVDQDQEAEIRIRIKAKAVLAIQNQMTNLLKVIVVHLDQVVLNKRKRNDEHNIKIISFSK